MQHDNENNNDLHSFEILQKITGKELQNGGIKLWLYNTVKQPGEMLNVSFVNTQTTPRSPTIVSQFNISLDFTVTDEFLSHIN